MARSILVIGVGNQYRRDDGAGLVVAHALRERRLPDGVRVMEHGGEGASLLDAWRGADIVILIDAVSSGAAPGTTHHIDTTAGPLPTGLRLASSHAFGVREAVELARALGQLPATLFFYGIEGADFGAGTELSPAVEMAARAVAERVARELTLLAHPPITP
jgi:hydrogenase maturation protease